MVTEEQQLKISYVMNALYTHNAYMHMHIDTFNHTSCSV